MSALTILLALLKAGVYLLRRIYGHAFWQEKNVESGLDGPSCHRFSLAQILLATEHFNEALVIGKGGFGKVYKGFVLGRSEILAIKRLKPDSEFWREIKMLSKLRHVNLVSLLGYCMEGDEMVLVYEYMSRGTVADNLYKFGRDGNERTPLTWEQRLRICIGAAHGLNYLHTGTQHGIIHCDVKATNILLDENLVAKISDFGLSKLEKMDETQGEVKGTIGCLDPEYIMTRKPSAKCDVYAFGTVLLEVLSARPAVERRLIEETKSLLDCYRECVTKSEMNEIIDPFLQGQILNNSLTRFMEAVGKCLHHRPKKRPSMVQVVVLLEHALEEQLCSVPFVYSDDTVVSPHSPTLSFEFQFAPTPGGSIISLPREGNNVQVLGSKVQDHKITQKQLRGKPWVSFRNILKPSKKTDLALPSAPMFGKLKHPIHMFSLKEIKLATEDFSDKFIIGIKGWGTMYKGFINDGSGTKIVAIKRFSSSVISEAVRAEVELMSRIHYIHLVALEGFCNESNELIVVYEYMPHGTLKDHLYGSRSSDQTCLTWEQRLKICIGAARGLNYLHEAGFVHRDVKGENIMFNEDNFVAKISDFGQCRQVSLGESETHVSTEAVGTFGYMDPKYLFSSELTKASDVYSFGIVLLFVLSGMPAFDSKYQHIKAWYKTCSRKGNFGELIDPTLVGGIPSASLGKYLKLVKRCVHEDPKRRPVMAQVVVNLEESVDLLTSSAVIKPSRAESSNYCSTSNSFDFKQARIGSINEPKIDDFTVVS